MIIDKTHTNNKTAKILFAVVFGMFVFAFAQVKFYGLFCEALGIDSLSNRVPAGQQLLNEEIKKTARQVTIRFDSTVNESLPWSFIAMDKRIMINPGEHKTIRYKVKNLTNDVLVGQSIASVTPWQAKPYLIKVKCFCHDKQTLQPGEEKEMLLILTISDKLPEDMNTLVLSYTFLNADKTSTKKYQNNFQTNDQIKI